MLVLAVAASMTIASCSKFEDPYTTSGKTPLADPSDITVDAKPKKADITWSAVPGAAQYYYEVRKANNFIATKGFTTETSLNLKGLSTLSDYTFYVKAIPGADDAGRVCGSNLVEFQFQTADPGLYIWEKSGKIILAGVDSGKTTVVSCDTSENPEGVFTLGGWWGDGGADIVFTVNRESQTFSFIESESSAFYWADYPNRAFSFYTDSGRGTFYWIYDNSTFFKADSDKDGGELSIWGWLPAGWSEYKVVW